MEWPLEVVELQSVTHWQRPYQACWIKCLERYLFLFGSDDRLYACIYEIGVLLTNEPRYHRFDVHGNALV